MILPRFLPKAFLLFILLLLTLPLHLLSTGLRHLRGFRRRPLSIPPSAIVLVSIPVLFLSILAVSWNEPYPNKDGALLELEVLKLKLTRLESVLQDNNKLLNSKMTQLEEKSRVIEEMELKIKSLQDSLRNIKARILKPEGISSYSQERMNDLEEEVRLLWVESRSNNFDIHFLESKAQDGDETLKLLTSRLQKTEDIVTEQWIQIRQLEQALQITKVRTSKVHGKTKSTKCTFMNFTRNLHQHHLPKVIDLLGSCFSTHNRSILRSYLSQAFHHVKKMMAVIQKFHHEIQHSVKHVMESNEFTSGLANREVIFFLASAVIVYPILLVFRLIKG